MVACFVVLACFNEVVSFWKKKKKKNLIVMVHYVCSFDQVKVGPSFGCIPTQHDTYRNLKYEPQSR